MAKRLTFYEQFPLGLMTPTHRPETGCEECCAGVFCYEHGYTTITEMFYSIHEDLIRLLSAVSSPGNKSYAACYKRVQRLVDEGLESQRPKVLTSVLAAGTRKFRSC